MMLLPLALDAPILGVGTWAIIEAISARGLDCIRPRSGRIADRLQASIRLTSWPGFEPCGVVQHSQN